MANIPTIIGGAVGAMGAVLLGPAALVAIGFTPAGIAAGSYAASMMSVAATANGGGVAAGSLVAVLQSLGAGGFPLTANMVLASTGFTLGAGVRAAWKWLSNFQRKKEEEERRKREMELALCGIAACGLLIWLNRK